MNAASTIVEPPVQLWTNKEVADGTFAKGKGKGKRETDQVVLDFIADLESLQSGALDNVVTYEEFQAWCEQPWIQTHIKGLAARIDEQWESLHAWKQSFLQTMRDAHVADVKALLELTDLLLIEQKGIRDSTLKDLMDFAGDYTATKAEVQALRDEVQTLTEKVKELTLLVHARNE